TLFDHIGLAVGEYAGREKIPFVKLAAGTNAHVWEQGNPYSFRTGHTNYLQAKALATEAAKLPIKKWATVAPNYEYGQSMVASFREFLSELRPDVEWVGEYWPEALNLEAGPIVQALLRDKPEGIFVMVFGPDVVELHREGEKRNLFNNKAIFAPTIGYPEELRTLGANIPINWVTSAYPYETLEHSGSKQFLTAFRKKFQKDPSFGALHGYIGLKFLATAIQQAGSTNADAISNALKGITIDSPVGPLTMRAIDNHPNIGVWIGETAVENDRAYVKNIVFNSAEDLLPSDETILNLKSNTSRQE
ncbi:MAG: ABC transporter substrate-binding protein, partial [Gammaproteobacteria bacterium]|nr:ABC transporter substrate-binding protein [Gammaproteobacteria bacterium]